MTTMKTVSRRIVIAPRRTAAAPHSRRAAALAATLRHGVHRAFCCPIENCNVDTLSTRSYYYILCSSGELR